MAIRSQQFSVDMKCRADHQGFIEKNKALWTTQRQKALKTGALTRKPDSQPDPRHVGIPNEGGCHPVIGRPFDGLEHVDSVRLQAMINKPLQFEPHDIVNLNRHIWMQLASNLAVGFAESRS